MSGPFSEGPVQLGSVGADTPEVPKLVWVTKYSGLNTPYTSATDLAITDRYQFGLAHLETINRKVTSMQAVWMNVRKENVSSAGSLICSAEGVTNLGTITIKYAWEVPKIDYRTSSPYLFAYGFAPTNTTNHTNYGAGTGGASQGIIVMAPHQFAVSEPIVATECCDSVSDANSRYDYFPPHFHVWVRQSQDVPSGEYPQSRILQDWSAGCGARGRKGATNYDSLVAGTGRPGSTNSDLVFYGTAPMGALGYVDDSADATKHLCIATFGSSHMEGPGSAGTSPQTSTTTLWPSDIVGTMGEAGACYDTGLADELARYDGWRDTYINLGCSSWSIYSAQENSQKLDAVLWAASHCHALILDWAANDFLNRSLSQMKDDFKRMTALLKERTGCYLIAKTPYPYGASGNASLDAFGDALLAANFTHYADTVYDCRNVLADFVSGTWRWKAGMSSDNVHINNGLGLTTQVQSLYGFIQTKRDLIRP